jgi:SAM-dependent methyltransferase
MQNNNEDESLYYLNHLKSISLLGRIYKRFFSSLIIFVISRRYGTKMVEVGSGIGSGVLGAFTTNVTGLDVNPYAVKYCVVNGMNAKLIDIYGNYPLSTGQYDVCILDNVLEHIEAPKKTLDECHRITHSQGGLIIIVPGVKGYLADSDHKIFYDAKRLMGLDERYVLEKLFALPSFFKVQMFSESIRQYCLVAVYKKNA